MYFNSKFLKNSVHKQEGQTLVTLFQYHTQHENILHVILIKVSGQLLCDHPSWKVVCSIIKQQF